MATGRLELFCEHCEDWWIPGNITVGVAAAHYEVEHGVTDVNNIRLVLDAACNRCQKRMTMERTMPLSSGKVRYFYYCKPCKRSWECVGEPSRGSTQTG